MSRITRKELKTDKFALEIGHTVTFFEEHRQEIIRYGGVALAAEERVECLTDRCHRHLLQRRLAVRRREARGDEQRVALAQRHVEVLGEVQHQLSARPGAAGLEEAQVPGGHAGLVRQLQLAEPAAHAPRPQPIAERDPIEGSNGGHTVDGTDRFEAKRLPAG